MAKPKTYTTMAALIKGYEKGELTKKDVLLLDNDSITLHCRCKSVAGVQPHQDFVFDSDPAQALETALKLLKIPFDNA
jgi:hypothetical protein